MEANWENFNAHPMITIDTHEVDGRLGISISYESTGGMKVIGIFQTGDMTREDVFLEVGKHIAHIGLYGWTSTDPKSRMNI